LPLDSYVGTSTRSSRDRLRNPGALLVRALYASGGSLRLPLYGLRQSPWPGWITIITKTKLRRESFPRNVEPVTHEKDSLSVVQSAVFADSARVVGGSM
jgi:hypothetical protein